MSHRGTSEDHRLDRKLRACDPLRGRVATDAGLVAAFNAMSAVIVREPRRSRWARLMRRPRRALAGLGAFAALGAGAAVAATTVFVPTHTHRYVPKGMAIGGGPGEVLNMDGTDFRRIALQIGSDVPFPAGYGMWRKVVITFEYQDQKLGCHAWSSGCHPQVPSGQLHGAFAASAFCAWVLEWRRATKRGQETVAAHAARVISGALAWKAVRDWDPHPSLVVPGDMGTTHPSMFGWMIPFIRAVRTGELARVDAAIVDDAQLGGQFALWTDTGMGVDLRRNLVGRPLLTYLDRHDS